MSTGVWCLKVYTLESNVLCRRLISAYIAANDLESRITILDKSTTELTPRDVDFNKVNVCSCHGYCHGPCGFYLGRVKNL